MYINAQYATHIFDKSDSLCIVIESVWLGGTDKDNEGKWMWYSTKKEPNKLF